MHRGQAVVAHATRAEAMEDVARAVVERRKY